MSPLGTSTVHMQRLLTTPDVISKNREVRCIGRHEEERMLSYDDIDFMTNSLQHDTGPPSNTTGSCHSPLRAGHDLPL